MSLIVILTLPARFLVLAFLSRPALLLAGINALIAAAMRSAVIVPVIRQHWSNLPPEQTPRVRCQVTAPA